MIKNSNFYIHMGSLAIHADGLLAIIHDQNEGKIPDMANHLLENIHKAEHAKGVAYPLPVQANHVINQAFDQLIGHLCADGDDYVVHIGDGCFPGSSLHEIANLPGLQFYPSTGFFTFNGGKGLIQPL